MGGHTDESPKELRAPSQEVRPPTPDQYVSNSGWALIWIDAILFVPVVFGAMFLPGLLRLLILSIGIALAATLGILYAWARVHPISASAHVLEVLHIAPRRRIPR
jgi:hypothetical protein